MDITVWKNLLLILSSDGLYLVNYKELINDEDFKVSLIDKEEGLDFNGFAHLHKSIWR